VSSGSAAATLAGLCVAIAACGSEAPDLFAVERSGQGHADVRMVVSDAGTVTCNGGPAKLLPSDRLLEARRLARDLSEQAELSIELPPRPGSVLRYEVRTEAGRVAFADNSEHRPHSFDRLVAFTQAVIRRDCGIHGG
jgi:hypothetical protein